MGGAVEASHHRPRQRLRLLPCVLWDWIFLSLHSLEPGLCAGWNCRAWRGLHLMPHFDFVDGIFCKEVIFYVFR